MHRRRFIALAATSMVMSACAPKSQEVAINRTRARVSVDPRIELMSIVHLLGGYFLSTQADIAYKKQATTYFEPHQNHPVVELAQQLADKEFSFNSVPDTMLRLTDPVELIWRTDLIAETPKGLPGAAERDVFLSALRDFAQASDFNAFFDDHSEFYEAIAARIEPLVTPHVRALETYVGDTVGDWRVISGPLMHDGGFAVKLPRRDGTNEAYALIGPEFLSVGEPSFGSELRIQDLIIHEFGHVVVNPLARQQPAEVARYESRFENLRKVMETQGYDDWPTVVNEHVLRAVTARIVAQTDSEEAGIDAVAREVGKGYIYVPSLFKRLRLYERDRARWPSLSAFYPELLRAFEKRITTPKN